MKTQYILYLLFTTFLNVSLGLAQNGNLQDSTKNKIKLIHADFSEINEYELPGVKILKGNVQAKQDGMLIYCDRAYLMEKDNYIKLFDNVQIIQNDTIEMISEYAEYNGTSKIAYASEGVVVTSPNSRIISQKIYYNKGKAQVYYNEDAIIESDDNQLTSKEGLYFVNESRYEFRTSVELTSSTTVIKTNHLDYYDDTGFAYIKDASTIENEEHFIYTEDGFYDTKANIGKLKKESYILYDNKRIEADDLYYERNNEYFRGIKNVRVTDTVNQTIATSGFAEVFRKINSDSVYLSKKPLIKSVNNKDSVFYHSKEIFLTGIDKERRIIGSKSVRMFQEPDMSAKADSLHYNQKTGVMELMNDPILFRDKSQITGEKVELVNNLLTEKLDSLKVINNAFMIQKDTIGSGFNQLKGINLYGKFIDNKLVEMNLIKNAEMIYYIYDDNDEFVGIDKGVCSRINLILKDNKIQTATRFNNPQSTTFPSNGIPENATKFADFAWREDERIQFKEDVLPKDTTEKTKKEVITSKTKELNINTEELKNDLKGAKNTVKTTIKSLEPKSKVTRKVKTKIKADIK